ncbi:unnamed protein product, partial [Rotaria magnacalcarata]
MPKPTTTATVTTAT